MLMIFALFFTFLFNLLVNITAVFISYRVKVDPQIQKLKNA